MLLCRNLTVILVVWLSVLAPAQGALPDHTGDGQPLPSLAPMLKDAGPAVVNISTYATVEIQNPLMQDPFFRRFFNIPERKRRERRSQSAGSGVIVDANRGLVLTNHHVIAGADEIRVTLSDGRLLDAALVGSDKQVDIALLKITPDNLTELPVADSENLQVGDFVVAIGNPFGLGQTVTSGIVSAIGRSGLGIYGYEDFIQTDASINPGNSGGALVNLRGELVGINSAILAPSGGNIGIGFAIPTHITRQVIKQLLEWGEVRRGQLGMIFQDISSELAEAFGLDAIKGAVVVRVIENSAAEDAGLQPGDIVLEANGRDIRNASDLHNRIGLTPIGETLNMTISRGGEPLSISAEIRQRPLAQMQGEQLHPELLGTLLRDFIPGGEDSPQAVELAEVDSSSEAYAAGLRAGDKIVAANRFRVTRLAELKKLVAGSSRLLLRIQREDESFYLVIR